MKVLLKHQNVPIAEVLKQHSNIKITRDDTGDFYIAMLF
jgi:hypothetical protein